MRCATCLLLDPASEALTPEELGARLARCDDCPVERGEAPCAPASAALLMDKLREATRAARRQRNALRKAQHALLELRDDMGLSEARVATLEQLQKESHLEVTRQLRAQIELAEQRRDAILALSTPLLQVWRGIVVLPLLGVLDDARAERLMVSLLDGIQSRGARHALLDLTGVPDIDVATAAALLRVVRAARLLGAEVLLCGVRPQVARAVTDLGVELSGVRAVGSVEEALRACGVGDARATAR